MCLLQFCVAIEIANAVLAREKVCNVEGNAHCRVAYDDFILTWFYWCFALGLLTYILKSGEQLEQTVLVALGLERY